MMKNAKFQRNTQNLSAFKSKQTFVELTTTFVSISTDYLISPRYLQNVTCSRHQSLQKFEFQLSKSFVMIFLMILQQTI